MSTRPKAPIRRTPVRRLRRRIAELVASLEEFNEALRATTAERERLKSELRAAREIQLGLLPKLFPQCPRHEGFEISARIEPARDVGGDLYDFFWIDDHRFFFMIGDVSEKGIPAALFMAVTKTLMKINVLPHLKLCDVLAKVNDSLAENNESMMFVTMFCGILDLRTGELEYCDGGHNAPCILPREAPVTMLKKVTGIALGLSPGFQFQSEIIHLQPGDGIFLYTDGITEAMNPARDQYTDGRLKAALSEMSGAALHDILEGVMSSVHSFVSDAPQSDDIAMLALRYQLTAESQDKRYSA